MKGERKSQLYVVARDRVAISAAKTESCRGAELYFDVKLGANRGMKNEKIKGRDEYQG